MTCTTAVLPCCPAFTWLLGVFSKSDVYTGSAVCNASLLSKPRNSHVLAQIHPTPFSEAALTMSHCTGSLSGWSHFLTSKWPEVLKGMRERGRSPEKGTRGTGGGHLRKPKFKGIQQRELLPWTAASVLQSHH